MHDLALPLFLRICHNKSGHPSVHDLWALVLIPLYPRFLHLNQDRYLSAAGIHNPALLPPPETVTFTSDVNGHDTVQPPSGGTAGSSAESHTGPRGPPLVHRVAGVVASALERAGSTVGAVSNWMRGHFERLLSHFPFNGEERAAEGGLGDVGEQLPAGRGSGARGQRKVDQVRERNGGGFCSPGGD